MKPTLLGLKHGDRVSWRGEQEAMIVRMSGEWALPEEPSLQNDVIILTDDGKLHDVTDLEIWQLM